MAKLEIPSIIVHNGSTNQPPAMARSARTQWTLSKQAEFDEDDEVKPTFSVTKEQETKMTNENSTKVSPSHSPNNPTLRSSRSQSKVKLLVRSHAVREETSPPPDLPLSPTSILPSVSSANINNDSLNNNNNIDGNCLSVSVTRHKLKREGSSQGSMDSNWSACLSRGSSIDQYTDGSGVDLEQFIIEALNKNQKDRMLLLKIEHELVSLFKDSKRSIHEFPPMSSYQRMLVHKVAAYFGMFHNVDSSGHYVIVNKTKTSHLPETKFSDLISYVCSDDLLFPEEPRRSILKRDSSSFDETSTFKSPDRQLNSESRRSKSFEEREEEYEKVRKRIFNKKNGRNHECSQWSSQDEDELRWPGEVQPWTSPESKHLTTDEESNHHDRKSRMLKVESYESKDTLRANSLRNSISKSFSFGGYDQSSLNTRILTKQDSGSSMSSRLSPSSSGYKSQSQDITFSATPSPSATPHLTTQLSSQSRVPSTEPESEQTVMWAVTNMAVVPPGSILINPQTSQPYTNSDGSIYHYDPINPPKMSSEEEVEPDPLSVKLPSQHHNDSDVKKKSSSELSNTMQQILPSCRETSPVVFCNKSSHSLISKNTEQAQILSTTKTNFPQLNQSQQQPSQTLLQAQVSPTTHVPHHPVPLRPQTYQPAYSAMGYCNIVLQPPGPPPEGAYSANRQQPFIHSSSPRVNPVPIPAAYDQRVTISNGGTILVIFGLEISKKSQEAISVKWDQDIEQNAVFGQKTMNLMVCFHNAVCQVVTAPNSLTVHDISKELQDGHSIGQEFNNYLVGSRVGESIQNVGDNRSNLYFTSVPSTTSSHPPPTHVRQDGHSVVQEFNNYLVGSRVGESIQNVGDNRSNLYFTSVPSTTSSHPPTHVRQDGHSVGQELNNYLVGLRVGERIQNVGDNRSILYFTSRPSTISSHPPPTHVRQGQNLSLPIFYAPPSSIPLSTNHNVAPRYQLVHGFTPLPTVLPMDRTGGGYTTPDGEWKTPTYPQAVHRTYYNRPCINNGHNSIPNACINNYTNTGPSAVLVQFPPPSNPVQPSSQPALPRQQNHICNNIMPPSSCNQQPQYTLYSNGYGMGGCYPVHYTHITNPPSHPSMMHPPNFQLGSTSSPPVNTYGTSFAHSRSPAMRERSAIVRPAPLNLILPENSVISSTPLRFDIVPTQTNMKFYTQRFVSGDVRLMGNTNHSSGFSVPANTNIAPPSYIRNSRSELAVVNTNGVARPVLNMGSQPSLLDVAGLPTSGYMLRP